MARLTRLNGDFDALRLKNVFANVRTVTDTATVALDDSGGLVMGNKGTGFNITIPKDTFEIGATIEFMQLGAGAVTLVGATDVTLNALTGFNKATNGQYTVIRATQYAANVWVVDGNLDAV